MNDVHMLHHLERALADDDRTNELGVRLRLAGDCVVAEGEVASEARRRLVMEVLGEQECDLQIRDQLTLSAEPVVPAPSTERISGRPTP